MKQQVQKIKQHFVNNVDLYAVAGVTAVVCIAGTYFIVGKPGTPNEVGTQLIQKISQTLNWKSNQVIINLVENSTPSKPVLMTAADGVQRVFNSLSEAARETGHSLSQISKNANGHISNVYGDVFTSLEPVAASAA